MPPTSSRKTHHATGLYLDGIRDGKVWEALNAHTGDRYTQHSTGVGDGQQGFADFFGPFLERNQVRDIQVLRTIEDGRYVFLHVYQSLNNGEAQWVTGDLFDTDENDRVIEHWDVIQAFEETTTSDRTMIDGPTETDELNRTASNKAVIANFCDVVLVGGDYNRLNEFAAAEQIDQHSPNLGGGVYTGLAASGRPMRYWKVHKLIGQGNFVVTLSHVQIGHSHYCTFDVYRLKDGKIVEHWDVQEKIWHPKNGTIRANSEPGGPYGGECLMHELSICENIVSVIEEQAAAQSFSKVLRVRLEIGPLAGVELEALRFSFDAVARGGVTDGAALEVIEPPATGWCAPCAKSVAIKQRYDPCPFCGSYPLKVTSGDELRIKNLEVE